MSGAWGVSIFLCLEKLSFFLDRGQKCPLLEVGLNPPLVAKKHDLWALLAPYDNAVCWVWGKRGVFGERRDMCLNPSWGRGSNAAPLSHAPPRPDWIGGCPPAPSDTVSAWGQEGKKASRGILSAPHPQGSTPGRLETCAG